MADPWNLIGWGIVWVVVVLVAALVIAALASFFAENLGTVLLIGLGAGVLLLLWWLWPWFVRHPVWSFIIGSLLCMPLVPTILFPSPQRKKET